MVLFKVCVIWTGTYGGVRGFHRVSDEEAGIEVLGNAKGRTWAWVGLNVCVLYEFGKMGVLKRFISGIYSSSFRPSLCSLPTPSPLKARDKRSSAEMIFSFRFIT